MKPGQAIRIAETQFRGTYSMPVYLREGIRRCAPQLDRARFDEFVSSRPRPAGIGELPYEPVPLIVADPQKWTDRLVTQTYGHGSADRAMEILLHEHGDCESERLFTATLDRVRDALSIPMEVHSIEHVSEHIAERWDDALQPYSTAAAKRQLLSGAIVHCVREGYERVYDRLPLLPQAIASLLANLMQDLSSMSSYAMNVAAAHNLMAYVARYLTPPDVETWYAHLPTLCDPHFGRARIIDRRDVYNLGRKLAALPASRKDVDREPARPVFNRDYVLADAMLKVIACPDLHGEDLGLYDVYNPDRALIVAQRALDITPLVATDTTAHLLFSEDSRYSIVELIDNHEREGGFSASVHYQFDASQPEALASNLAESMIVRMWGINPLLLAEIICTCAPERTGHTAEA